MRFRSSVKAFGGLARELRAVHIGIGTLARRVAEDELNRTGARKK